MFYEQRLTSKLAPPPSAWVKMLTPKDEKYLCDGNSVFGSFDSSVEELDPHVGRRKRRNGLGRRCD